MLVGVGGSGKQSLARPRAETLTLRLESGLHVKIFMEVIGLRKIQGKEW